MKVKEKYQLGLGLSFEDLHNSKKLSLLDKKFLQFIKKKDIALYEYLIMQRKLYPKFSEEYGKKDNEIIIIAKYLEEFLLQIFPMGKAYEKLQNKVSEKNKIFLFRKLFINKHVKNIDYQSIKVTNFNDVKNEFYNILSINEFQEDLIINKIFNWLANKDKFSKELNLATCFMAHIIFNQELQEEYSKYGIFFKAKKYDFFNLIKTDKHLLNHNNASTFKAHPIEDPLIVREDFNLYKKASLEQSMHHSNYCVKCHNREKDSCRVGEVDNSTFGKYKINPLGEEIHGCPISMHISQMHVLNEENNLIAALGVITINNPLVAATGNNICYDCVNSCIFQKQERVKTPLVESVILKEVLNLPFGFEIYSLLTRWNPLRAYRPYIKKNSKKNILVVGAGPAGYSLSYNLMAEGHNVVLVDALKIEPIKITEDLIFDVTEITEDLDNRVIMGFGGVSEYGITARWDKNYLKIIRIILERQKNFHLKGSIKFGASLDFSSAIDMGFHHIALCVGAGNPNFINMENIGAKGIKTASEFLMTLHLGAFKKDYLNALQIRLPIVVLGAGLTAVDAATEALLYYKRQVEKFMAIYNSLLAVIDEKKILLSFTKEEIEILEEYKEFYNLIKLAKKDSSINLTKELQKIGGVFMAYHKSMEESKAYKNNYEELQTALNLGVNFLENVSMEKIHNDEYGALNSISFKNTAVSENANTDLINVKAKTLILALGTNANNNIIYDFPKVFAKEDASLQGIKFEEITYKGKKTSVLLKKLTNLEFKDNLKIDNNYSGYVSFFGDMHPIFRGSVVKAIASTLYGYSVINKILNEEKNILYTKGSFKKFIKNFDKLMEVNVVSKVKINKNITELTVKSPLLANKFHGGMFFKVQNYETNAPKITVNNVNMKAVAEPIFLTGIRYKKNIIKMMLLNSGSSANIISNIDAKNLSVLGPLGRPSHIPFAKNLILIGGGVANLSTIALLEKAKAQNNKIIYFAGYKDVKDIFYLNFIKNNVDVVFLSTDNGSYNTKSNKTNIISVKGNVLDSLRLFLEMSKNKEIKNNLNERISSDIPFRINEIDSLIVAGSASMMAEVQKFMGSLLATEKNAKSKNFASINAFMQCGLGGICASCLQKHVENNQVSFEYTCKNQEKPLQFIDFNYLKGRLGQNSLQEKLFNLWFNECNI